eukprot:g3216.t1
MVSINDESTELEMPDGRRLPMLPLKEAMDEIGKRMLQGWKLIDAQCPLTSFPLVEKDGVIFSGRLNLPVQFPPKTQAEVEESCNVKTEIESPSVYHGKDRRSLREKLYAERTASLIARGWKQTSVSCPITNEVCLLVDTEGRAFSVAANQYMDEVVNNPAFSGKQWKLAKASIAAIQDGTTSLSVDSELESPDTFAFDSEAEMESGPISSVIVRTPSECSKKISQLLLQGWKMLAEHCPVTNSCPLMQNREGRNFSVALDKFLDELENENSCDPHTTDEDKLQNKTEESNDEKKSGKIENSDLSVGVTYPVDKNKDSEDERRKQRQQWSKRLGQLMLQGWTMLGETCPVTHKAPLMQNREGRKYSVVLEKFLDEVACEENEKTEKTEVEVKVKSVGNVKESRIETKSVTNEPFVNDKSNASQKSVFNISSAVEDLFSRLDSLRKQLNTCPPDDFERCEKIARAMTAVAKAADASQQLQCKLRK